MTLNHDSTPIAPNEFSQSPFTLELEGLLTFPLDDSLSGNPSIESSSSSVIKRTTRPLGRSQKSKRRRITKIPEQPRIRRHTINSTPPIAPSPAVKPPYNFVPLDEDKQTHPFVRQSKIAGLLHVNLLRSVRVTPSSLAALRTSPKCLLKARAAASSVKCASDAGRFENVDISDQSSSDNLGFHLGQGRFGATKSGSLQGSIMALTLRGAPR